MDLELAVQPADADSRSLPGHNDDGAFRELPCSVKCPAAVEKPPPLTAKSTRVVPSQMAPSAAPHAQLRKRHPESRLRISIFKLDKASA